MTSQSTRMGLIIPSTSDQFSTQDIAGNWGTLDKYPGSYLCTSASRPNSGTGGAPTWTTAHKGMSIIETDTNLSWRWTGTAFVRSAAVGRLGGGSNPATVSATVDYVTVVAANNLSIPAGNRWLQITMTWDLIQNTVGAAVYGLFIDGVLQHEWGVNGNSDQSNPQSKGGAGTQLYYTQLNAGIHSFSTGVRAVHLAAPAGGGTSQAAGTTITVVEV